MPFQKGQSGNPGGRPKGYVEVRELARKHTAKAIRQLARELTAGETSAARIAAAVALLDRGWGRPTQPVTADITTRTAEIEDAREVIDHELDGMAAALRMGETVQ